MRVKLLIEDRRIVSAMLYRDDENPDTALPFTETEMQWGKIWSVRLTDEKIECTSRRTARDGQRMVFSFLVRYNGTSEFRIITGTQKRTIAAGRVFSTPGNFNGTLSLLCDEHNRRFAEFQSREFREFLAQHHLEWLARKDTDDLLLRLKGKLSDQTVRKDENGFSHITTSLRCIITDGEMELCTADNLPHMHITCANWVLLVKKSTVYGKYEQTLFSKHNFIELKEDPMLTHYTAQLLQTGSIPVPDEPADADVRIGSEKGGISDGSE